MSRPSLPVQVSRHIHPCHKHTPVLCAGVACPLFSYSVYSVFLLTRASLSLLDAVPWYMEVKRGASGMSRSQTKQSFALVFFRARFCVTCVAKYTIPGVPLLPFFRDAFFSKCRFVLFPCCPPPPPPRRFGFCVERLTVYIVRAPAGDPCDPVVPLPKPAG